MLTASKLPHVARPGKPGLTDKEADLVRSALRRLKAERYEDNDTKLGEALGVTQSAVSQMWAKNKPSFQTAERAADLLGLPVMELLGKAGRSVEPLDPYPNRARAIQAAKLLGFDEADIARVQGHPGFKAEDDPPPLLWFKRIERARDERLDPLADRLRGGSPLKPEALPRRRRGKGGG